MLWRRVQQQQIRACLYRPVQDKRKSDAMNTMTPPRTETTTARQIDKTVGICRAMFEKYAPEFDKDAVQQALGAKGLVPDLFAVFRTYVERFSNMITRLVKVDRSRTSEQALAATNRKQYTDPSVVATMPKGNGEEVKIIFFKVGRDISDDDLEKEYELRGLIPADPISLATVNEIDPTFADEHPNAIHWKDANGKWCYAAFRRWDGGGRVVSVSRHGSDWSDSLWFAGLAS